MKTIKLTIIILVSLFHMDGYAQDAKKQAIKVTGKELLKQLENSNFIIKWKKKIVFKGKSKKASNNIKFGGKKTSIEKKAIKGRQIVNRVPSSIQKEVQPQNVVYSYSLNPFKGAGHFNVEKSVVDASVNLKSFNRVSATLKKDLSFLKMRTTLNYQVNDKTWEASIDNRLSDHISTNVTANNNSEIKSGVYFNIGF